MTKMFHIGLINMYMSEGHPVGSACRACNSRSGVRSLSPTLWTEFTLKKKKRNKRYTFGQHFQDYIEVVQLPIQQEGTSLCKCTVIFKMHGMN